MCAGRIALLVAVLASACGRGAPEPARARAISQAAYVWQRNWTPGVRAAVAHPLADLDGLHVLAAEVEDERLALMGIDDAALAAALRPITLVVRINGSRPVAELSLAQVVAVADRLRTLGVEVVGIEVDHDCATARLAEYAGWLTTHRPPAPLRFSITALPTWAGSPVLARVAAAVDDIVVQVHAIRAPIVAQVRAPVAEITDRALAGPSVPRGGSNARRGANAIFDGNDAWQDLAAFANAVAPKRVRVALPTYSAVVNGLEVGVDPDDVSRFVRRLEERRIVDGVVWFRLPVAGDEQTWSAATFARVVTGHAVAARATVALVARGAAGVAVANPGDALLAAERFDIVVSNASDVVVEMPAVRIDGAIAEADLVQGYREQTPGSWQPPRRSLAGGERLVIGWISGKDLELVE